MSDLKQHPEESQLTAFVLDELDEARQRDIATHLSECDTCRAEVEACRQASAALFEALQSEPVPTLSEAQRQAIQGEAIQGAAQPAPQRLVRVSEPELSHRRGVLPLLAATVACAALLVGVSVWNFDRPDAQIAARLDLLRDQASLLALNGSIDGLGVVDESGVEELDRVLSWDALAATEAEDMESAVKRRLEELSRESEELQQIVEHDATLPQVTMAMEEAERAAIRLRSRVTGLSDEQLRGLATMSTRPAAPGNLGDVVDPSVDFLRHSLSNGSGTAPATPAPTSGLDRKPAGGDAGNTAPDVMRNTVNEYRQPTVRYEKKFGRQPGQQGARRGGAVQSRFAIPNEGQQSGQGLAGAGQPAPGSEASLSVLSSHDSGTAAKSDGAAPSGLRSHTLRSVAENAPQLTDDRFGTATVTNPAPPVSEPTAGGVVGRPNAHFYFDTNGEGGAASEYGALPLPPSDGSGGPGAPFGAINGAPAGERGTMPQQPAGRGKTLQENLVGLPKQRGVQDASGNGAWLDLDFSQSSGQTAGWDGHRKLTLGMSANGQTQFVPMFAITDLQRLSKRAPNTSGIAVGATIDVNGVPPIMSNSVTVNDDILLGTLVDEAQTSRQRDQKLAESAPNVGLSEGEGTVTLSMSDVTSHGGMLASGDRVDVFLTYESESPGRTETRVLLENIEVVSTGDPTTSSGTDPTQTTKDISLRIAPEQMPGLLLAKKRGTLSLAWRRSERPQIPGTEAYAPIEENEFLSPTEQPLSTFGLDVDTASYANVRRFLMEQRRFPPPDAVRIEEMVNYFAYSDPAPTGEDPLAVHLESSACPWNTEHHLVRIGLKAKQIDLAERPATTLVFLVDTSGSMRDENKLPLVKNSLRILVDEMTENDRIAIVTYSSNAGLLLDSTSGEQQGEILAAIDGLQANGSTNGEAGLKLAYEIATRHFIQSGQNRVILCTDGDFNVGTSATDPLVKLITEKRDSGVFLSICGYGSGNIKDEKLERIADTGNGQYHYVDNIKEARKVFLDELTGTLYTVAKDVKLQVEFNPAHVGSYRLLGYENRKLAAEDFNNDRVDSGDMGAGHSVTALYEVVPTGMKPAKPAGATPGVDPLKYQPAGNRRQGSDGETSNPVKEATKALASSLFEKQRLVDQFGAEDRRVQEIEKKIELQQGLLAKLKGQGTDGDGADLKDQASNASRSTLNPQPSTNHELLTVKLRYKQPDGKTSVKREFPLVNERGRNESPSNDLEWSAAVVSFGMLLRSSSHAGQSSLEGVLELAQGAKGRDESGRRREFIDMVLQTRSLVRGLRGSPTPEPRELSSTEARQKATVGGKYGDLLDKFEARDDASRYGEFHDYGWSADKSHAGREGLPSGYWVYVYPDWYIWAETVSKRE